VRLFLDSSVVLAACGSDRGASREVFRLAKDAGWVLLASPYVIEEVLANLPELKADAAGAWARLRPELTLVDDVLALDRPAVFEPAKDRPILFTGFAWSQVLLRLDRVDFGSLIGSEF
jgi:hypothetical protein